MIEVYKLHVPLPVLPGHVDRLLDIAQHGILDGGTLTQFFIPSLSVVSDYKI
jgi:hypothetical protein